MNINVYFVFRSNEGKCEPIGIRIENWRDRRSEEETSGIQNYITCAYSYL